MKIERETFTPELYEEILPLAQKCWRECTQSKGESCAFYGEREFDIEPNLPVYLQLAAEGSLVAITLRDEGLKGYVLGFVYPAMHHKHVIGGIGDTMYVEPKYRESAGELVDRFILEMGALKAGIIGWPVIPGGYIHKILKSRGFVRDDIVMEKRL